MPADDGNINFDHGSSNDDDWGSKPAYSSNDDDWDSSNMALSGHSVASQ